MRASATLLTSLRAVRQSLITYPNLLIVGDGTSIRCVIEDSGAENRFYLVEIKKDCFSIEIHSIDPPLYFINEALLRLISIATLLGKDYKIDLYDILTYFTQALAAQQINDYSKKFPDLSDQSLPELTLSRRIIGLLHESDTLHAEYGELNDLFLNLLAVYIIARHPSRISVEELSSETKADSVSINEAMRRLQSMGYKAVQTGKLFDLVKI